jgi:hypothetical protein
MREAFWDEEGQHLMPREECSPYKMAVYAIGSSTSGVVRAGMMMSMGRLGVWNGCIRTRRLIEQYKRCMEIVDARDLLFYLKHQSIIPRQIQLSSGRQTGHFVSIGTKET